MLQTISLSNKLAFGALFLALGSVLACVISIMGLSSSATHIDTALNADRRLEGYSALSSQMSSLAIVGFEQVRDDGVSDARNSRIETFIATINATFEALERDLGEDVRNAQNLGLNEQSRRATRGLNLARMRAAFDSLAKSMTTPDVSRDKTAIDLNIFSSQFQPLLANAIQEEQRVRDNAYAEIEQIRLSLTRSAIAITILTLAALTAFIFGLIRPQLARLERLQGAARDIASENFDQPLPERPRDEIGRLFGEVNNMADQLGRDRAVLNETIAQQTQALRVANQKLTHSDENRRRFFADVSHEMRTPLTVILMEAELAQRENPSAETFPAIISRARLLSRRIDDLLRISKSESGILSIERLPFDLKEAAMQARSDLLRRAERLGFGIKLVAGGPFPVTGDQNWVRQVITGLIDNALHHSGKKGEIRIEIRTRDGHHHLDVIDAGQGVDPQIQPTVFDRFKRGAVNEGSTGFGIGLGLAAWIVEEHGGQMSLASPPPDDRAITKGEGTMIALSFPQAKA